VGISSSASFRNEFAAIPELACIIFYRIVVLLVLATLSVGAQNETPAMSEQQVSTQERLQKPGWWPRKATPAR
jgi:hypothetical protein